MQAIFGVISFWTFVGMLCSFVIVPFSGHFLLDVCWNVMFICYCAFFRSVPFGRLLECYVHLLLCLFRSVPFGRLLECYVHLLLCLFPVSSFWTFVGMLCSFVIVPFSGQFLLDVCWNVMFICYCAFFRSVPFGRLLECYVHLLLCLFPVISFWTFVAKLCSFVIVPFSGKSH